MNCSGSNHSNPGMHPIFRSVALALAFCAPVALAADYTATLSTDLRTMEVRACFENAPQALRAGDQAANQFLEALAWAPGNVKPVRQGTRLVLPEPGAAGCLSYRVDVGRAADQQTLRRTQWAGDDLLTTPELWLWRDTQSTRLTLALPEGMSASVPWPSTGKSNEYRVDPTPRIWAAQMAVGRLRVAPVALPGGTLHVALSNVDQFQRPDEILSWVTETARAITTINGRFPREETQVLIIPGNYDNPVPWGQVLRGGAPAIQFYVAQDATLDALRTDWTAFHELSHLLLPFVQRADAYLSEGFASYFQNVTRGRSGNLGRQEAWANLHAGFERGRRNTRGQTLQGAARKMGREGNYMRVYWSGAALALLADVQLRVQTGQGLDDLLAKLRGCCLNDHRAWSAARLAAELDRLSGTDIFAKLNDDMARARTFPNVQPVLEQLGVLYENDSIRLDDDAPLAAIRRAIMSPYRGDGP
ncbi:MAG: hypothetical protein AB8G17_09360 [Gammaproteobacteria bacterium]